VKHFIVILLLQIYPSMSSASETHDDLELEDEDEILPYVVIQYATDFYALAQVARDENKIIMLEVSASYCGYCDLLEEEFIKPMLRNDYYSEIALIRKIDLDSYQTIIDFSGNETTPDAFARDIKVALTPTILFFDSNGREVSPRILGINSLDLYGGYIEDGLNNGLLKINSQ